MPRLGFPPLELWLLTFGISRLTVNLAFSKLQAEGYLLSKAGSGTFVANPLPESFLTADKFARRPAGKIRRAGLKNVFGWSSIELALPAGQERFPDQRAGTQFDLGALGAGAGISLVPGLPAVDEFPIDIWERLRIPGACRKRALIYCCGMHRVVAMQTCVKPLPHTCAILEARAVIRIKS